MVGPLRAERAFLLRSKHQACQWLDIFLSRPQIHTSSVAYFYSKQAVFLCCCFSFLTKIATSQAERGRANVKIRGRILARKAVIKDPPLVVPLKPAAQLKPERHEKSQERCVCVCVFYQFVTVVMWQGCGASKVTAAAACQKSPTAISWWTDLLMLNALQKQGSEGEETLCGEWGGETPAPPPPPPPPSTTGSGCPGSQSLRGGRRSLLFRRGSQAVQLPLIQAFPVFKVVIQVLHKIGKVCESWRNDKKKGKLAFLMLDL